MTDVEMFRASTLARREKYAVLYVTRALDDDRQIHELPNPLDPQRPPSIASSAKACDTRSGSPSRCVSRAGHAIAPRQHGARRSVKRQAARCLQNGRC